MRNHLSLPVALLLCVPALAGDKVVMLVGEDEYGSAETMPGLAAELAGRLDVSVDVRHSQGRELPPVPAPEEADLLVLFLRFREATDAQMERLAAWFDAGKPVVALRTTSHAFVDRKDWFPPYFGGHYKTHADNDAGTIVATAPAAWAHPVLRGVPLTMEMGHGGTYDTQPLSEGATVLMFGRTGDLPAQPVAWTFEYRPDSRIFYTSLGSRENFEQPGFRRLLTNAVLWGLEREVPEGDEVERTAGARAEIAPARRAAPEGATVLFDGVDLGAWRHWDPSVEPRSVHIDERADTSGGGPRYDEPRWRVQGGALIARPGFGDLLTRESFGDHHLHLEFLVPSEAGVPDDFRGASGVYLAGRYEVALLDSYQKDLTSSSCGALFGQQSPATNASRPPGTWQTLDLTYSHHAGGEPRISAWLNDVRVLTDVTPTEATAYGFLGPLPGSVAAGGGARHVANAAGSAECDWGEEPFTVSARFRSRASGTLVSKCPPGGKWVPNAKALFLRGGRLVYDIGWVGALTSEHVWNDGNWHRVVLTSDDGVARLYVDGELDGEHDDFSAEGKPGFVFKVGDANNDFGGTYDGDVEDVRFYDRSLDPAQAAALSQGEDPGLEPIYDWGGEPDANGDAEVPLASGDVVTGPIRLQADCSPVRFANIWVQPLGEVDHAGLLANLGSDSYRRGAEIFSGTCRGCHGEDGMRTLNPKARPFATGVLENGNDPLSMFHTVTSGYKEMPSNAWLRPDQRYDVIHYVRERFLKPDNPSQHFEITDAYLNALPKGLTDLNLGTADELPPRDWGPVLASQLGDDVGSALTVRLDDDTSMTYDLQVMESPAAWTGGFLDLAQTQHYQQRGEARARPGGDLLDGLEGWGWGHGGTLDWDRSRRPDRGPLPTDWLEHHGHYVHGDRVVLSYAVDQREVLELPGVDRSSGLPVITHRITVGPGSQPLVLAAARAPHEGGRVFTQIESSEPKDGLISWELALATRLRGPEAPNDWAAVATLGGGSWEADEEGRLFLRIPPSKEPAELFVLRLAGTGADELRGFKTFLDSAREREFPGAPAELTHGGPPHWSGAFLTHGELGEETGPYTVDTLPLPPENPWNAWLRTSALDFYADGRAAVAMYGGDVWIVSGIDESLENLSWRRFAAGLFEPMGVRIVDGELYVTCRDRITRLHDLNGDREADYYESFFADPDVSPNFHAFNFDLQTDAEGNFYYAKSGQYTDFNLGGAIVKIGPDGKSHEIYCTGLRTPNGMGMSPAGRPLVSDNQGNWIPASKVSLAKPGGFYGVFPAIGTNTPGEQTRDDFDQPVIWMPQDLDSSSGGQLWVDDPRFGPLSGRYLHTSFGKGWMYVLMIEDLGDVAQAGMYRLPFQFDAGLQRLRMNPADGQVYTVGLSGWQGPPGGADGCLQRLRYTGREGTLLIDTRVRTGRLELEFSGALDRGRALSEESISARRWNYRWARSYGSAHYSVANPGQEGEDEVAITGLELSPDGRTLSVGLEDLAPVNQLFLDLDLLAADGSPVTHELYVTVNRVPDE